MNTIRACGCKGIRTCLKCERYYKIYKPPLWDELQSLKSWSYCPTCSSFYEGWNTTHPAHGTEDNSLQLPGVLVIENFLTSLEGSEVMRQLDALPWTVSQSGRRKQNFGPKTNFKKRKLRNGEFHGFPKCTEFIQSRFCDVPLLENFQSIEQCSLEYDPKNGASIDPHIDDCWIWGERVVTVNCLGDAVLTLTLYDNGEDETPKSKYNLDLVQQYENQLISPLLDKKTLECFKDCVLRIPMPALSLIVLYGPARYQYEHAVLREDINERRVCIAYREFTPMYINGARRDEGEKVTENAKIFCY